MQYSDEKDMQNFKKVNTDSWDSIKDDVYVRLINAKYIPKYGDDIAYKKYLDLALTFSVQEKSNDRMMSHILTNEELNSLQINIDDVIQTAMDNTRHDRKRRLLTFKESILKNNMMYPVLKIPKGMMMGAGGSSMADCGIIEDVDIENESENILMLCNKHDTFGSSYMVIPEILEEVYSRFECDNFYIIPLSIHQVMCVKSKYVTHDNEKPTFEVEDDLLDMIESFNDTNNKSWKDILSYKIYYYMGDDGKKLFLIQ